MDIFFRQLLRFQRFRFVQVVTADRGIGQDGHGIRLHFQQAAGDEDELFFCLADYLDADRARTDAGNQRRVAWVDTQLALFTRQRDEFCFA